MAKDRFEMNFDREQAKKDLREEWHLPKQARIIIHVGSAFYRKGVDRAIEAIACLPQHEKDNTWLFVIGNDDAKKFATLAEKRGIRDRIIFTGPRNDVDAFYQGSDILVHPAREECAGMTIMEALYCGLPVRTTENSGFAWHVKNAEAGSVVDYPFEQAKLNQAVSELLALSPAQYATLSENAKQYCLAEDVHNLAGVTADVIEAELFSNISRMILQLL